MFLTPFHLTSEEGSLPRSSSPREGVRELQLMEAVRLGGQYGRLLTWSHQQLP